MISPSNGTIADPYAVPSVETGGRATKNLHC